MEMDLQEVDHSKSDLPDNVLDTSMSVTGFKSSDYPVPEAVQNYLKAMRDCDSFNSICVDCQKDHVEFANVSFGTYICSSCA